MAVTYRNGASGGSAVKTETDATDTAKSATFAEGASDEFEFGGSLGTICLMIGFPLIMWYMWIGATYYDGHLPMPEGDQSWGDFARLLVHHVNEGAYPTGKAWAVYWTFFIFEAVM